MLPAPSHTPPALPGVPAPDTLLDELPWGVLVLAPDGRVLRLNQQVAAWWGAPSAALCNQPLAQALALGQLPAALGHALRALAHNQPLAGAEFWLPATGQWLTLTSRRQPDHVVVYWQAAAGPGAAPPRLKDALDQRATDKYSMLFNSMEEGFCVVEVLFDQEHRPVDYRHLDVNPVFEQQSGLRNMLGRTIREVVPTIEPFWIDLYAQVALTGLPTRCSEYSFSLGRWFDVYARRIGHPAECQVAVLFTDITERKQREENHRFLAEIQDDLARFTRTGEIVQAVGDRLQHRFGAAPLTIATVDEAAGTYTPLYPPGAAGLSRPPAPLSRLLPAARRSRLPAQGAFALSGPDSLLVGFVQDQQLRLLLALRPAGPCPGRPDELALLQEIVGRLQLRLEKAATEEALRASEEQFRLLIMATSDTVYRMSADWQELRYLTSRDALLVANRPQFAWIDRYVPVEDQPQVRAAVAEAISRKSIFELEHRVIQEKGTLAWVYSRAIPILDAGGNITAWLGVASDVTARKQAEAQMRNFAALLEQQVAERTHDLGQSLNLLQSIFDTSLIGMSVLRAVRDEAGAIQDFEITIANKELQRETGRSDLVGKHYAAEYPGIRAAGLFDLMLQALATGQPQGKEYYYPHEGFDKWFSCMFVKLDDGLLATNLDITAQKLAAQQLRHSQELLQSVFDSSLNALAVLRALRTPQGEIEDFEIVLVDPTVRSKYNGLDPVGQRYSVLHPGVKQTPVFEQFVATTETGRRADFEVYYGHEQYNQWFRIVAVKLHDGVVTAAEDITDRRQAEQERAKSLQLLEQSEAVASMGSWDYELATGVLHWSAGMYQLFNLAPNTSVTPRHYLAFALPEAHAQASQLVRTIEEGHADFEETLRLLVAGELRTLRIKGVVVRDDQGQPCRVLGVDLDVSRVQRLEADNLHLRLTQQQTLFNAVLQAQEAERKRIAEGLHNGVGQLLYATKLRLDQLAAAPVRTDPALHNAYQEADRLLVQAIGQTRALSHELVPQVLEEFGLEAAFRSIGRQLSSPGLRVRCHVQLEEAQLPLPPLLPLALYRMAQELGQNIIKHATGATEASLELEAVPGFVLLRAEDNGVGFPAGAGAGKGLGLGIIHDRVKLLGGTLELGSSAAFGTYVRIRIPLPPVTPAAARPSNGGRAAAE